MRPDPLDPRLALLVEDEALVAMIAEENLRSLGFDVIVAGAGAEALAAMDGGARLSVAIVDVGLPDMRGDALAHRLRDAAPDLPIILASGYDSAELKQGFPGDARLKVLAKPYSESQLRQVLRELDLVPA